MKKHKQKPGRRLSVTDSVAGKAFSLEKLMNLIAELTSGSSDREITAVAEYAENKESVDAAVDKETMMSDVNIEELVIAAVLRNEAEMLKKFGEERKATPLTLIRDMPGIPSRIKENTVAILKRLHISRQAKKPPEPAMADVLPPKKVKDLLIRLESPSKETRITAAIAFVREYPRIVPTVSKMPLLTVTEVTSKAIKVIDSNPGKVFEIMKQKKMLPELLLLSSFSQAPMRLQKQARATAEALQPKAAPPAAQDAGAERIALQKTYSPFELEALLSGLGSVERVRAVKSAAEFLKNYDMIVKVIAETPMLTVTEVTVKAVKVIEENLNTVIKELVKSKEKKALLFLAHSSKFSKRVRTEATMALERMKKSLSDAGDLR